MDDIQQQLPHWVEILERVGEDDSDTVKVLGPYASQRIAKKAESGVNRNLNHDRFWTRIRRGVPT